MIYKDILTDILVRDGNVCNNTEQTRVCVVDGLHDTAKDLELICRDNGKVVLRLTLGTLNSPFSMNLTHSAAKRRTAIYSPTQTQLIG